MDATANLGERSQGEAGQGHVRTWHYKGRKHDGEAVSHVLTFDPQSKSAYLDGTSLHLTALELRVFEFLVFHEGATCTKAMLLDYLYGGTTEPDVKILDVFVSKLRTQKFDADPETLIKTVWGRGYYIIQSQEAARHDQVQKQPLEKGVSADPLVKKVMTVRGPDGLPLSLVDLPSRNTRRWVIRRKAEVVCAINGGLLTLEEASERYNLPVDEFLSWKMTIEKYGLAGLRITRVQQYRS